MKERPIIFSGPMVRAILDGRKTQTRRVVRPQPKAPMGPERKMRSCPYGAPGERLWVRETFCVESCREVGYYPPPFGDGRPIRHIYDGDEWLWWEQPHYRSTDPTPQLDIGVGDPGVRWRPPMFMPRWASRITLQISKVRVERLQEIRLEDAWAEGIPPDSGDAIAAFADIWDRINAKRGFGWDANPWVWVVQFHSGGQEISHASG
ncbi:MAG: hypothetical protein ACK5AZ_08075 [Bryobacteraceae bacterium]